MTHTHTKYFHNALTSSIQEMTVTRSIVVLSAVLATVAFAPRSSAQEPSKMSVAVTVPKPSTTDTAASRQTVIAVPESVTVDTVKKTAGAKSIRNFLSTAPGIQMQNYRPEDKRGINVFEARRTSRSHTRDSSSSGVLPSRSSSRDSITATPRLPSWSPRVA